MGVINETLKLTDQFSSSFRMFMQMGSRSVNTATSLRQSTERLGNVHRYAAEQLDTMRGALAAQQSLYAVQNQRIDAQKQKITELTRKYTELETKKGGEAAATLRAAEALGRARIKEQQLMTAAARTCEVIARQNAEIEKFSQGMESGVEGIQRAVEEQERLTEETQQTESATSSLVKAIRDLATVAGAVKLTESFLSMADEQAQIKARLELMNDGSQDTDELQDMLYNLAQRTRTDYSSTASMVAGLGQRAGDAFSSNAEIIQFVENLNKQFAIAGASQQEIASASLQLTQALGAGALRGEELNAVFEAAPNIIQTIADYMGKPIGSIREMAAEGEITAEIVKNALLSATKNIDEQFLQMPMTLAQAFTMGKNAIQKSLRDSLEGWNDFLNSDTGQTTMARMINLFAIMAEGGAQALSVIGQGALWASNNLGFILPVLLAIGIGMAVLRREAILTGAANVKSALVSAAGWTLAHWPILLLIVVLAGAMIAAQQFGIGMAEVCGWVGQVLGMLYAIGYNVFASLWNIIAAFAEFFANVWDDPLGATARLFFDIFDAILGIVETTAGAIDALLGTSLSGTVAGFRSSMSSWVDSNFGENAVKIKRMTELDVYGTSQKWGEIGSGLGKKLEDLDLGMGALSGGLSGFSELGAIGNSGDIGKVGSVGKVKSIEGDVNLSDEDLKIYRDLVEQRYMNRIELKTMAPNINVTLPPGAGGNLSAQDVADEIRRMLVGQIQSQTAVSHP